MTLKPPGYAALVSRDLVSKADLDAAIAGVPSGGGGGGELVMLASDYGVVGNGTTDDSAALNALLTTAATAGKEVWLAPNSIVRCVSTITVPSGTRLNLNGATLKNASTITNGKLLTIQHVSDVLVYNGSLDGDKASYAPVTESRHNIMISHSDNVTLRDIWSFQAKGDGVYVGDNVAGVSTDIVLINVWGEYNHRNGLSLTYVNGFTQFGGGWRYTSGTSPKSGCDIEANNNTNVNQNIQFFGVAFDFNDWNGFVGHTTFDAAPTSGAQKGVTLVGCTANGNGVAADVPGEQGHGFSFRWAADYSLVRCEANSNAFAGVRFRSTNTNLSLDVDCANNRWEGVRNVEGTTTDLRITGRMLNNGAAGSYDGINLAAAGSRAFIDVVSGGNTRYGIRTVSGWSEISYGAGCRFAPANTSGAYSLGDTIGNRLSLMSDGWRFGHSTTTTGAFATRSTGDVNDRFAVRVDGRMGWGTGAATADVTFERTAAGVLAVGALHALRTGRGTTAQRPDPALVGSGTTWFDTTAGILLVSNGTAWVTPGGSGATGFDGTTDIEFTDATKGVIMKSPAGTRFRLTVTDDGSLTTTAL